MTHRVPARRVPAKFTTVPKLEARGTTFVLNANEAVVEHLDELWGPNPAANFQILCATGVHPLYTQSLLSDLRKVRGRTFIMITAINKKRVIGFLLGDILNHVHLICGTGIGHQLMYQYASVADPRRRITLESATQTATARYLQWGFRIDVPAASSRDYTDHMSVSRSTLLRRTKNIW